MRHHNHHHESGFGTLLSIGMWIACVAFAIGFARRNPKTAITMAIVIFTYCFAIELPRNLKAKESEAYSTEVCVNTPNGLPYISRSCSAQAGSTQQESEDKAAETACSEVVNDKNPTYLNECKTNWKAEVTWEQASEIDDQGNSISHRKQ